MSAAVKSFIVFRQLRFHRELAIDLPILEVGTVVDFEEMTVMDPDPSKANDPRSKVVVSGPHVVYSKTLKFRSGLKQYLEFDPVPSGRT